MPAPFTTLSDSVPPKLASLALLMLPLAALVVVLRLLEATMIRTGHHVPAGHILLSHGIVPLVILILGIQLYFVIRSLPFGPSPLVSSVGATAISVVLLFVAARLAPPHMGAWIGAEALEVVRWDLAFVLALTVLLLLSAQAGGRVILRVSTAFAHVAAPLIATLAIGRSHSSPRPGPQSTGTLPGTLCRSSGISRISSWAASGWERS